MSAKEWVRDFDPQATIRRNKYGEDGWKWCVQYEREDGVRSEAIAHTSHAAWQAAKDDLSQASQRRRQVRAWEKEVAQRKCEHVTE